jgi:GNAT superfamily N-acetyltransferase
MTVHSDDTGSGAITAHDIPHTEVWLAVGDDGTIGGLLVLDRDWLDQLYVEPTLTRGGIGAQLVEVAKRERPRGLRLWTFEANQSATVLRASQGFVARDCTDGDNEVGAPDVLYVWDGD